MPLWSLAATCLAAGTPGGYPLRLVDALGRTIVLPRQPRRIVSLAPSTTEMLFAVGAGPAVVGVTRWCDYPAQAARLPRVGDMNIDLERVITLRPDLVVGDGRLEPRVIAELDRVGVPVLAVAPRTLGEVLKALTLVGQATGHEAEGRQLVDKLSARVRKLTEQGRANSQKGKHKVFVLLDAGDLYTAGPGTFIDELIRLAGGVNIAADAKTAWPVLSEEALIDRNPDIIVATYLPKNEVLSRPRWQGLSAVKSGRVFSVDPDLVSRPGPRLVDGLAIMVNALNGN